MKKKDQLYAVICKPCGAVLVSWSVHDYRMCSCDNQAMIDGGRDYLRVGAKDMAQLTLAKLTDLRSAR